MTLLGRHHLHRGRFLRHDWFRGRHSSGRLVTRKSRAETHVGTHLSLSAFTGYGLAFRFANVLAALGSGHHESRRTFLLDLELGSTFLIPAMARFTDRDLNIDAFLDRTLA